MYDQDIVRRALSFRNLLINWLLGEKCKPIIIRDANKAFHFLPQGTLSNFCTKALFLFTLNAG
jgi:hypothetical protein